MPNINLSDKRNRDAVVKAESVRVVDPIRYLGPKGGQTYTRRILKSTVEHDNETLTENYKTPEAIAEALIQDDPEVDIERFGQFLWNTSKVYVSPDEELVFRVQQTEIVRGPAGKVVETRDRDRPEPNVDAAIPLRWTGKLIPKQDAIKRFLFASKLQVVHINGLTYDFLHGMATELSEANSLLLLGAGESGKDPLIFRRGSIPYRGFLEGRVDGDKYILLLHLSNMEMKLPKSTSAKKPKKTPEK